MKTLLTGIFVQVAAQEDNEVDMGEGEHGEGGAQNKWLEKITAAFS